MELNREDYAFALIEAKSVTLPKTVREIGLSVFAGVPEIVVYDTIDSSAKPAKDFLDNLNGGWNGRVGFIGIMRKENYLGGACNANWYEHTIIVRSSVDDSVKFRLRMTVSEDSHTVFACDCRDMSIDLENN